MPFHITARVQAREPLFIGLEPAIVQRVLEHVSWADVALHAYAVMPNHLHLVLTQGSRPLAALMQPLLRRIALLVMCQKGKEGHIFERRYFDVPCIDADHFRNAIAYTHLNGWRAGLCAGAHDFAVCSHQLMCSTAESKPGWSPLQRGMECSLRMFAQSSGSRLADCTQDYLRFVSWRMAMDRYLNAGGSLSDTEAPVPPHCQGGDDYWDVAFAPHTPHRDEHPRVRSIPDLRDLANDAIAQVCPGMDLNLLRSGDRGHCSVRVRRHLIPRALAFGHSQAVLARFLNVAPTTISSTLNRARRDPNC